MHTLLPSQPRSVHCAIKSSEFSRQDRCVTFQQMLVCPWVRQKQISLPKYGVSSRPDTHHNTISGRTSGQLEKSPPEPFVNPPLTISKNPNRHNGTVCERKSRCVNVVISTKVWYYRATVLWWPMNFSYETKSHKTIAQSRSVRLWQAA